MVIAEAGMYKTVMERQVLVVIYSHKEHPKKRDLLPGSGFLLSKRDHFVTLESRLRFFGRSLRLTTPP